MTRSSENDQRLMPLEIAGLVERGRRVIAKHKTRKQQWGGDAGAGRSDRRSTDTDGLFEPLE